MHIRTALLIILYGQPWQDHPRRHRAIPCNSLGGRRLTLCVLHLSSQICPPEDVPFTRRLFTT